MGSCLLGIDIGLTATKVVVYDPDGRELGSGETRSPQSTPQPEYVECDMLGLWNDCRQAIHQTLQVAGVSGCDIAAIGIAGHGDGVYLLDDFGRPVRPAILSLDSRAREVLNAWRRSRLLEKALELTGQYPFAASPAALLTWLQKIEPESVESSSWVLSCKDWIKFKLTGEVSTDPTEASASFTDVRTQAYSGGVFRLYGLEDIREKLPPVIGCTEVMGEVSRDAAAATGLSVGTPVVSGLQDVDSGAVGAGCMLPGQLCVVAGTWSINQIVSTEPMIDHRWACRNFVEPGRWMSMAASPASAANLEWFVERLCTSETTGVTGRNYSPIAFVEKEVEAVLEEKTGIFYHPFLYGSPHGDEATAGFFGLRGWHNRGHLLRALTEGIVFNHKTHVDALREKFEVSEIRLAGGMARSEIWRQMFADVLGAPVLSTNFGEEGALGAALCAGVGVQTYDSLQEAANEVVRISHVHEPNPERYAQLSEDYETYLSLTEAINRVWRSLD